MKNVICSVCPSATNVRRVSNKSLYCESHRKQFYKHGRVLPRKIREANDFKVYKNHIGINLYNVLGFKVGTTLVDTADFDAIKAYKWHLHHTGYAQTNMNGQRIRLHRFILGNPPHYLDHQNENKLDNRRCNLRAATSQENSRNKQAARGYSRHGKKWVAYITVDYKILYLGIFKTEEEARVVRRKAEKKYFGTFAPKRGSIKPMQ